MRTDLSCPQLPVRGQAVSRVHEDFGNAESFLDGLQLEPQQVAVDAVSSQSLSGTRRKLLPTLSCVSRSWGKQLLETFTCTVSSEYASTASLRSSSFASLCGETWRVRAKESERRKQVTANLSSPLRSDRRRPGWTWAPGLWASGCTRSVLLWTSSVRRCRRQDKPRCELCRKTSQTVNTPRRSHRGTQELFKHFQGTFSNFSSTKPWRKTQYKGT